MVQVQSDLALGFSIFDNDSNIPELLLLLLLLTAAGSLSGALQLLRRVSEFCLSGRFPTR
jgi:hypothetical protein